MGQRGEGRGRGGEGGGGEGREGEGDAILGQIYAIGLRMEMMYTVKKYIFL
jgi:hypothetical protein